MESTEQLADALSFDPYADNPVPDGLPAFETVNEFTVIHNEEEAPFLWLQAVSVPNLAFITIDPFLVQPAYRPDICDSDVKLLGISKADDAFILSIVTVHNGDGGITANLVSPVVINWKKQIGKQVILNNHRDYVVNYRIDDIGAE